MGSVAGILLAAGFSRRLGRPKQEVLLAGEPLLLRAARTAVAASLTPIVAVMRDEAWRDRLAALGVSITLNHGAAEGMASSVRAGVRALGGTGAEVAGAIVLTCDQPLLLPEHLRTLYAEPDRMTASAYSGRKGVPAYFPRHRFADLLQLQGDAGARALLGPAHPIPNESLALDVDTEEQLQEAEVIFAKKGLQRP